ncbi:hypothetical protein [Nocardia sp. NPDC060259]
MLENLEAELDGTAAARGLAVTGGFISDTGIGGGGDGRREHPARAAA